MQKSTSCEGFEWMIGPLVDGELPPADVEEAQSHLATCPSCRKLAEEIRSFDRLAARMETPPPVSAAEWARVLERVRREPAVVHLAARRRFAGWILPAFSAAALALFSTWIVVYMATKPEPKRLDEASVKVLTEDPQNPLEVKFTPDAVIIEDKANL